MTTHSQQDDRTEAYRRIADPATYRAQSEEQAPAEGARPDDTAVRFPAAREEAPPPSYDESRDYPEDDAEYADVRRRERFGGVNWGAGFFGWLVAAGMTGVLTTMVAAVLAVLDGTLNAIPPQAQSDPRTMAVVAAAILLTVVVLAYFSGGYVAGRMSRFDGGKQGAAVWVTGLLLTTLALGVGLLLGTQYDLLDRVPLPSLPMPTETVGIAGAVGAVVALLGTLLAAIFGGKVGCRYHRKVDTYGYDGYVDA
jgi:hypothetical protein